MRRLSLLWVPALWIGTALPLAAQSGSEIFDPENTSMDAAAYPALGVMLANYALKEASASSDFQTSGSYRKLIRVAFQLASKDEGVVDAHERLKAGQAPGSPRRSVTREELVAGLVYQLELVLQNNAAGDRLTARYLTSIGLLIAPDNEVFLAESKKNRRWGDVNWESALAVYVRKIPDGTTCRINGLFVMSSGTAEVGQVARILLTYKANTTGTVTARLIREQGGQMTVSSEEAIRYWERFRREAHLPGGTVEISFEDKFTKKDGPSAGAAYAVLLRSFSDPFKLDPAAAMTGDMSVEGRILPVGGIYAKIRGATLGGCKRVGIPAENEGELMDSLVLNDPAFLAEIEVIALHSVDEAIELMRADRSEAATKATADFETLKPLVLQKLKGGGSDSTVTASIQKLTEGILASNPRHLTAKVVDLWNRGKLIRRLTLAASLDEAHGVLVAYLLAIQKGREPSFGDVVHETGTANVSSALDKMRGLIPKLHLDAQKPAEKLEQCCSSLQRFIYMRSEHDKKIKKAEELNETVRDLKNKVDRARAERRPAEEVNRLVKRHNQAVDDRNDAVDKANKFGEERKGHFVKAIDNYNAFVTMVRTLTQDPKLLEKLKYGK